MDAKTYSDRFEVIVGIDDGMLLTDDGREVLWVGGVPWALRLDEHAKMLANAFSARQKCIEQTNSSQQSPTCSALIDGQLCGGSLSATPVCPKCALGKQGVAQIMTCDVCGAQTAVMR